MFFTVLFVLEVQAQSPTAAKLKPPLLSDDLGVDNPIVCKVLFFKSLLSPASRCCNASLLTFSNPPTPFEERALALSICNILMRNLAS